MQDNYEDPVLWGVICPECSAHFQAPAGATHCLKCTHEFGRQAAVDDTEPPLGFSDGS